MVEAMEGISRWIVERRPEIPSQVIQQMDYHCNLYLTHLAITDEQLGVAFRHQIAAWRAQPQKLLSFTSIIFGVVLYSPASFTWVVALFAINRGKLYSTISNVYNLKDDADSPSASGLFGVELWPVGLLCRYRFNSR